MIWASRLRRRVLSGFASLRSCGLPLPPADASKVEAIPVVYRKPPRRFLGIVLCRHSWQTYWKPCPDDESVQIGVLKCARCLREQKP